MVTNKHDERIYALAFDEGMIFKDCPRCGHHMGETFRTVNDVRAKLYTCLECEHEEIASEGDK